MSKDIVLVKTELVSTKGMLKAGINYRVEFQLDIIGQRSKPKEN